MLVPIILIILLVYLLFWYKSYIKKYKDINKLPGPSIKDIINVYRGKSEGLIKYYQSLNKKYGPIVKIGIKPMPPVVMTTDPEFIEKIYKSNEFFYSPFFGEVETLIRNGIITTKIRETWKNDKQIINKTVSPAYISNSLMIYNKNYDEFIKKIYENLEKPIELESNLSRILATIVLEGILDPKVKITPEEINEYIVNRKRYMNILLEKLNSINIGVFYKFTKKYKEFLKCAEDLIQFIDNLLERHKNIPKDQREKYSVFYTLMENGMSDDKITDTVNAIIGASFETTTLPSALTLYELGKNPELQEKLLQEILSILGPESTKQISLNDLNKMTYLNCVVKESVRLFYPFTFVDRLVTQDVKIKDILIPKDTHVIFNFPQVFKSEENFENAEVFNPDRFLSENFTEDVKKVYVPFGFGAKLCSGKKLASLGLKLLLVKILRKFKICLASNNEVELKSDIVFRSVNGVYVVFQERI